MNKKMLISLPDYDPHTHYLHEYSKPVMKEAQAKNWVAHTLSGPKAVRANAVSRLSKNNYNFVFFNGHGTDDSVLGHNDIALFKAADSHFLKNCIIYLRCCYSINQIHGKGAIGYSADFQFWGLDSMASRPMEDYVAKPVFDASNLIASKLLKGSSVQNAMRASRRKARDIVADLLSKQVPGMYDCPIIDTIVHNDICLEATGDLSSSC